MAEKIRRLTTKEDILKLVKAYPKHETRQGVIDELGWPEHMYTRILTEVKKVRPELFPKKSTAPERLSALIEEALKEL